MQTVRFEQQGNPLYPLPPDYYKLSADGQWRARVNALHLQETPEDLVHAWSFFRRYYLEPADTGWYKRWEPSPSGHYLMIHDIGKFSRNVWAAPREFSKTTVCREAGVVLALTRPHFAVSLVQATIKKYRKSLEFIRWQLERNPYLNDDFGRLYGEPLKPKRGARPWGSEMLWLPNGATLEGGSVESALRGDRPDLLIVDDPEYDEDETTDPFKLLEDFEHLLFHTMLPMLAKGCGLFWIGTLISRQAYIYQITKGEDPRFRHFNRRVLTILDDQGHSVWEEKWNSQTISDIREERGTVAFEAEYMNNPGSASARILKLHPELAWYTVDGEPWKTPDPLQSEATLIYPRRITQGENLTILRVTEPFGLWASRLYRMATVDYIRRPSMTSDYACIGVWGFDEEDYLWALDLFLQRITGAPFVRKIFEMAIQWRVRIIGVEAVPVQEDMAQETAEMIKEMSVQAGYLPRVFPIRYARRRLKVTDAPTVISKPERIAAMEARFARGKIRLPADRKREFGFAQLIHQIENFTLDESLLRFDDALDTLAMHQWVPRRKGLLRPDRSQPRLASEILAQGDLYDDLGLAYVTGAGTAALTDAALRAIRDRDLPDTSEPELIPWPTGPISLSP